MGMKNLDQLQQKKAEIMNNLHQAIQSGDETKFAEAFAAYTESIEDAVMAEARGMVQAADANILAGRGARQLTSEENKYYEEVIQAMRSSNPRQALTDLDVVMPKTVIDTVFEDVVKDHSLLEAITFTNTSGMIEMLMNKGETHLASWSGLTAEIAKELSAGFKKVNLQLFKLSAFVPVAKSMLDLGPTWMDRYVRAILGEAIANGLEEGIVTGNGKEMPIGMNRQVGEGVTVTDGVYPEKDAIELKGLDPVSFGAIIAGIATKTNGDPRIVKELLMIVNPVDYFTKVFPATTVQGADGTYRKDILPFPTKVEQSVHVPQGKSIIGLGRRYFMGIGTGKSGKVEFSDDYRFLEDERIYLTKLYGYGEPLDNNAFVVVDITNLKAAAVRTMVVNEAGEPMPVYYPVFDARALDIVVGSLTLDPEFNKSNPNYTSATTNATNAITVTPVDEEATIEIDVDGTPVVNGASATWADGINVVTVNITSGTETEKYTIEVTKS